VRKAPAKFNQGGTRVNLSHISIDEVPGIEQLRPLPYRPALSSTALSYRRTMDGTSGHRHRAPVTNVTSAPKIKRRKYEKVTGSNQKPGRNSPQVSYLKPQHQSSGYPDIVLRIAKQTRLEKIYLGAPGEQGDQPEIGPASDGSRKRRIRQKRSTRIRMRHSKQRMREWTHSSD
jgi:hypothetical protein